MKVIRLKGQEYTEFMHNPAARAEIKKSHWDKYGPTLFMKPNGRILAVLRADPGAPQHQGEVEVIETSAEPRELTESDAETIAAQARSIKRMKNSGQMKSVPSPKGCKCLTWPWPEGTERPRDERGKPTTHHPKCAFALMYERQKGAKVSVVHHGPTLAPRIHRAVEPKSIEARPTLTATAKSPTAQIKEKPLDKIPAPDRCPKCKDFTKSKKMEQDQHHPTCIYFKKYKAITEARKAIGRPAHLETGPAFLLFDIEEQTAKRGAEPSEVEEAQRRLRDEGSPFAEVDGKDYLVMKADGESIDPAPGEPQHTMTAHIIDAPNDETPDGVHDTEPPSAETLQDLSHSAE